MKIIMIMQSLTRSKSKFHHYDSPLSIYSNKFINENKLVIFLFLFKIQINNISHNRLPIALIKDWECGILFFHNNSWTESIKTYLWTLCTSNQTCYISSYFIGSCYCIQGDRYNFLIVMLSNNQCTLIPAKQIDL